MLEYCSPIVKQSFSSQVISEKSLGIYVWAYRKQGRLKGLFCSRKISITQIRYFHIFLLPSPNSMSLSSIFIRQLCLPQHLPGVIEFFRDKGDPGDCYGLLSAMQLRSSPMP